MPVDTIGDDKNTQKPPAAPLRPIDAEACLAFWNLDGQSQIMLHQAHPIIMGVLDRVGVEFYDYFSGDEQASRILACPSTRQRAVAGMLSYWDGLFSNDMALAIGRAQQFGHRHYTEGVSPRLFLAGCYQVLSLISGALLAEHGQHALPMIETVTRAVMMTAEIGLSAYFDTVTDTVTAQRLDDETKTLQEKVKSLEEMAYVDGLTWLFNRRYFDLALAAEIARATRQGGALALLMIDIDHFKQVNDTYGHDAGDRVLCRISDMIRHTARRSDIVARFGGEEFTLILPGTTWEAAVLVAERLRETIEKTQVRIDQNENAATMIAPTMITVTVSGGLSMFDGQKTAQDLVKEADRALYRAKQGGRNRIEG